VAIVGIVLLRQITDGLVDAKTTSSVGEATRGSIDAQRRLSGASGTDFDSATQLDQLVRSIVQRGQVQGYDVVLIGPVAGSSEGVAAGSGTRAGDAPRRRRPPRPKVLHRTRWPPWTTCWPRECSRRRSTRTSSPG
jgi:two-component system sensor histidine kinase MtrB